VDLSLLHGKLNERRASSEQMAAASAMGVLLTPLRGYVFIGDMLSAG